MVNHLETIVAPSAIQKLKKLAEPPPPPPPAVAFGPGDAHKSSPLEVRRRGGAPEQVGRRFDGGFDEFVPTACTPPPDATYSMYPVPGMSYKESWPLICFP